MPSTTPSASTASAGPATSSGSRGSTLRVIVQTVRIWATRPVRSAASVFSFGARAMALSLRAAGPHAVGHHCRPRVAPGDPLAAIAPQSQLEQAGEVAQRLPHALTVTHLRDGVV